jgi:hypothetical protein
VLSRRPESYPSVTDAAVAIDPFAEIERLRAEVEALRARAEAAEAAADHDVLTPTLNRRGFVAVLNRTMAYCKRYGAPAVLLYLDLDGFKGVNDSLGHAAGWGDRSLSAPDPSRPGRGTRNAQKGRLIPVQAMMSGRTMASIFTISSRSCSFLRFRRAIIS